ncbi:MAG: PAS domain S-box protein [Acidobacteriota bacterium]|nr:PAS domain S-box protein [Acidobacteriota bacterium]
MSDSLAVLLVDDSESDAALIVRSLEKGGYAVQSERVQSAAEMRSALSRRAYDVILSDYNMPEFSALAALDIARETGLDLPFLIVSGVIGEETAVAMMKAGAGDFVIKNSLGRLAPAVRRELAEAQMRRERAQARMDQKKSEERFRQMAENAGEWIWEVDMDGLYTYSSPVIEKILGYAPEELIGKIRYYDLFTMESREEMKALVMAAFAEGRPFHGFENPNRHKDGRTIILETNGVAMRSEDGRLTGYRGVDKDITERKKAEEKIRFTQRKLEAAIKASLAALTATIEIRDPYTAGHQERVMRLAEAMAREMGLSEERVESVRVAGAIHDLGKIAVPAEILSKPSKLSAFEYQMVQTHAQVGFEILAKIEFPWPLSRIVHEHHERLDGSGYPQKLKGPVTLLESRILAIADVVEAMSSHRPYRPALGIKAALAEIEAGKGRLYDETAVEACLRLFTIGHFTFD